MFQIVKPNKHFIKLLERKYNFYIQYKYCHLWSCSKTITPSVMHFIASKLVAFARTIHAVHTIQWSCLTFLYPCPILLAVSFVWAQPNEESQYNSVLTRLFPLLKNFDLWSRSSASSFSKVLTNHGAEISVTREGVQVPLWTSDAGKIVHVFPTRLSERSIFFCMYTQIHVFTHTKNRRYI